jgi:uncharacterized protein YbaR (Trm112 family)
MALKSLLCPVTKHKIDLRFPERRHCADEDEPQDGLDDNYFSGFYPIDEVSPSMLVSGYFESAKDREQRILFNDDVFVPNRIDTSGTLYELFADFDTDNEVAERCGLCDEGDEAIPVSHCSVSRAACKPTPEQADGRIERNTTTKTLKRAEWYERKSLDGDTIMETRKVMKVIYHHSHGLRGRKPIKPSRETLRRMQVVDHSTSFLDQEYAEVMSG